MSETPLVMVQVPPGVRLRAIPGAAPLGLIFGTMALGASAAIGLLGLHRLPFSVCVFKMVSGLPCPTCGVTLTLGLLFELDLAGAIAMNPLAAVFLLALVPWAVGDLLLRPSGRAVRVVLGKHLWPAARAGVVLALVMNWAFLIAFGR